MKLTKSSVHRLQLNKDCGCRAIKEFEDARYTKALGEGTVVLCEKHNAKAKDTKEILSEMLLETLDLQAEAAGKTAVVQREFAPTSLSGVTGEQITSMGAPAVPKTREKCDPLAVRTVAFERPDMHRPRNTSPTGNLNLAQHEDISDEELQEQGITITGDIDSVPPDPRVDAALGDGLKELENVFDDEDAKAGGVDRKLVNIQAVD
jgi:hypothetical protein